MNFVSSLERFDPRSLAMRELAENPEAVALAKIVRIARPFVDSRPINFALFDCGALAKDALSDLIFEVAGDVLSLGEVVDGLLGAEDLGVPASPSRCQPSASASLRESSQSGIANAGDGA